MSFKVKDLMTEDVLTARTDTPARKLVEMMAEHGYSGVPVVSEDGCVLGVVTEADIVVKEDGAEPLEHRRKHGSVAGELMTVPAVVVNRDDDLRVAARKLIKYGVKRLPVVSGGKLCGVISRRDVLKAFLRSDDDIRAEVEQIINSNKILDPDHEVTVDVRDGVVTLRGTVTRKSTAKLIGFYVDRIDGVTNVIDGLLFAVDDSVYPSFVPPIIPTQQRL